jgi:predicted AlkP superfamily phosphohydrolase/phosphomutase
MDPLKLFVFGVDGASASVLDNLIERGMLPTFAALRKRSSAGVLQSTFPPHTAPGWASMFTGVEPGEHGIYQFWSTQPRNYIARGMNVADFGREPIWRTLERHGYRVGVNNVPMTHPPAALRDGYMISWPLSKTLRYTAPAELMSELAAADLHYHSDIVTMFRGQADYREQAKRFVEMRARTCLYLQETRPVDAMLVVFTELDRVSHYYWGDNEEPGEDVESIYVDIDRALNTLLALVDDSTLIVIASDHGFGRCVADFNVHEALEQHDLLKTKYVPISTAAPAEPAAKDDTAQSAWFESSAVFKRSVDWTRTRIYMPTPGCFGLNANLVGRESHGIVETDELPQLERDVAAMLETIVDEGGRPWFQLVRREHVYAGARLEDAPDYLLIPRDLSVMPAPSLAGEIWSKPSQPGVHRPDGIVWMSGSTFPAGRRLHARIEDVYPAILAHLGIPVPDALDGHWLVEPAGEVTRERAVVSGEGARMTPLETAYMDSQLREIGYF